MHIGMVCIPEKEVDLDWPQLAKWQEYTCKCKKNKIALSLNFCESIERIPTKFGRDITRGKVLLKHEADSDWTIVIKWLEIWI